MKFGVEGHDNLEKDMSTKAVLNKDSNEFKSARLAKSKKMTDRRWKQGIENEISAINNKLDSILTLLAKKD